MKIYGKYILGLMATCLLWSTSVNAALLNVGSGLPDLTTAGASLDYTFTATCFDVTDGATSGICGGDNGANGPNKRVYGGALDTSSSSGLLTISGTSNTLDDGTISGGFYFMNGDTYSLTANFDGFGNIVTTGSNVNATYSNLQDSTSGLFSTTYTSGQMINADLTQNGFGGTGNTGIIDFFFSNITGDLASFGTDGGINISAIGTAGWTGNWDTLDGSGLNFWQHSFNDTAVNVNTFVTAVPLPAAVWLFGSGLLALMGFARRKTH